MLPSSSPRLYTLHPTLYTLHSTPSNLLRVHDGFISHHHYVITMRLVCDNYVIQTTSMEHMQTRITSTASATTSYPYISMCANCDFSENIAWVFGVNRVFWAFFIYPIYPKNPKYCLCFFLLHLNHQSA